MDNPKPAAQLPYGSISAAIWRNETDKGTFYNVTFQRSYKEGEDFKNSQSFGREDLLLVAKLTDIAHTKIFELQHGDNR